MAKCSRVRAKQYSSSVALILKNHPQHQLNGSSKDPAIIMFFFFSCRDCLHVQVFQCVDSTSTSLLEEGGESRSVEESSMSTSDAESVSDV